MTVPFLDAGDLARLLPADAAIDALERAFAADPLPAAPHRTHLPVAAGDLLLMPSWGERGVGVKLVTIALGNPARGLPLIHGLYVLFDAATLAPVALADGGALTAIRTAAVSGLATRHLARRDASRLVVFGAGTQARSHVNAMLAVRPVDEVVVVSRSADPAERLVADVRRRGIEARVGDPGDVAVADIVCTCTTSPTPVLDGALLPPGVHVNAVGAYRPETRELDDETVRRGRLVVETRDAALAEAGDLLIPIASGVIARDAIAADLSEVVRGAAVRRDDADVTVFKSVGVAFEDLAVAAEAVARMER